MANIETAPSAEDNKEPSANELLAQAATLGEQFKMAVAKGDGAKGREIQRQLWALNRSASAALVREARTGAPDDPLHRVMKLEGRVAQLEEKVARLERSPPPALAEGSPQHDEDVP